MTTTADEMIKGRPKRKFRVVDGQHRVKPIERVLEEYDATPLVGLRTLVHNAAIERALLRELLASAAVKRCIMPLRLRGSEVKAMRRILKLTLAELAKKLDER